MDRYTVSIVDNQTMREERSISGEYLARVLHEQAEELMVK